jgi:hypothetical protein
MAKQLVISYQGKEYTLEYTKRTAKKLEQSGVYVKDIEDKPLTVLPALFAGAFQAHHPFIKQDIVDDIYAHLPNKLGLVSKLGELYNEPLQSLIGDPEEDEGNATWEANWTSENE